MRTLVSILAVCLTFASYAQKDNNQATSIALEDVLITSNANYLQAVQDESTPATVKKLQREVATYSLRENSEFDQSVKTPFEMVFKNAHGQIDAFYDVSGKVISSFEKFRNILLPETIRDQVFHDNLDWEMISNQYSSSYSDENKIKRTYKIKLRNGDHKKDIVIKLPN